ncbi:hypothetical protein [Anaerobaca lacustris]|uniref:Uncharacterized protein n=1 Tax=Anaerobaca lacustris TaxID=3044600 RepID=A0AAW6U7F9_9BACT|nr:hypothetical protein [Sedimentisphaerales bacterium M17dextr]
MVQRREEFQGVARLATLTLPDRQYFIDLRLGQFRDTQNAACFVAFDSQEGQQLCRLANVVSCRSCRTHVIVSRWLREAVVRCMRCGLVVE